MNTKKAIKIIRKQGNYVHQIGRDKYIISDSKIPQPYDREYDGRDLVNYAKIYTSEGQKTSIKRDLKYADKRKNRSATRQALSGENYDLFFFNKKAKQDDIWYWD